ncbi:MAG: hypothetical protein ACJ763_06445 [Bdellovibrionia bacterium]
MRRLARHHLWIVVGAIGALAAVCHVFALAAPQASTSAPSKQSAVSRETPPTIQSLLKPEVYQRVLKDRGIATYANLKAVKDPDHQGDKEYSFYAVMQTRAGITRTRQVLTDYQLYSKLIPYVDEASYQPSTHLLTLQGGIWKWKLRSILRFEEKSDRWIHFQIVGGHFTGMTGDIFFEPGASSQSGASGIPGTLVFMRGNQQGSHWPPTFILEQGAQIVFEFTAKRMRSYLESNPDISQENSKDNRSGRSQNDEIPKPRSHL